MQIEKTKAQRGLGMIFNSNRTLREKITRLGSIIGSLMFVWTMLHGFFPRQLRTSIQKNFLRYFTLVYPYIQIRFNEFNFFTRSEAYSLIQTYLSDKTSTQAKRLKANVIRRDHLLSFSMDDYEEVEDEFNGVKVWWVSGKENGERKGYYKLMFHKKQRSSVLRPYMSHVLKEGKDIRMKNRQRKLYTNSGSYWLPVLFEHPATFQTLGMGADRKKEILDDLTMFSKSEEYYAKIGKAWKRGYLLYGPPGTGKSTLIAAMANLLGYDIYDLELTAVTDNSELRRLLMETSSKSIIVIEDIDCSLDFTGKRKEKKEKDREEEKDGVKKLAEDRNKSKVSKVTLSGLLNFIDGLWSACRGERLIIFTTNYVEKLDPALIRRGRMDMHIELSYCDFESFKVLAKNYIDIETHHLFDKISELLGEVNMSPADVAENLMPKIGNVDGGTCLERLIGALETAKEEARLKTKQEEKAKKEVSKKVKDSSVNEGSTRKKQST